MQLARNRTSCMRQFIVDATLELMYLPVHYDAYCSDIGWCCLGVSAAYFLEWSWRTTDRPGISGCQQLTLKHSPLLFRLFPGPAENIFR